MKTFFFLLLFLAVLALFLIAALPAILSTEWGKTQLVALVNRSIPGKLELKDLSLDWQKGQVAEGIVLKDPDGNAILSIQKFETATPLWKLLRNSMHLGMSHLQELNAILEVDENGHTNFERALNNESILSFPTLVKFTEINGTFNFADNRDLSARLEGKASQNNQTGTFEIDLLLPGFISSSWPKLQQDIIKYFSFEGSQKANFYAKINNFPVRLIDQLEILKTNPPIFHAFLGDHFDLILNKKPSHEGIHFDLAISSPLTSLDMEGQLNKEILTLKKPLKWNFLLTPEIREIFIKKKIPVLRTAIQGENPIALSIDPTGFSCPLNPFDVNAVQIERGKFELGKIQFHNEGELSSILNLISPIQEKQFTIWFTPIYFQMHKGAIHLKRFDFLVAHLYQLASWGQIDLKKHQSSLILGLTSQSLDYAFGVKGLKEDYILQIPMIEKNGKIEVDKKQAAARISTLLAQVHGNSQTKLLGNILELVAKPDTAAPPLPTTTPFPWSNAFKGRSENTQAETEEKKEEVKKEAKKKRKKNQQLILEELEKEASGLLKKWIK